MALVTAADESKMAEGKPTIHHMNHSQSQRILWLLEELRLSSPPDKPFDYNLVLHRRVESGPQKMRAPPDLADTHPLGKAPQLVTANGKVIAESSAIAKYLIDTYDASGQFTVKGEDEAIRDESLTSFANSSISLVMIQDMFMETLTSQSPFFIRPLFRGTHAMVRKVYSGPEMEKMFKYLDSQLEGRSYFMGETPGRADFMVSWPVDFCVQRGYVNLELKGYERVKAWRARCQAREGWKESLKKGNGYDLKMF